MTLDGVDGVAFVVLAPNARGVSVVGDFNFWNRRRHPMRVRGVGYWELFIPQARIGDHYKFDIIEPNGQHLPMKADPFAFAAEVRPKTASIVFDEANYALKKRGNSKRYGEITHYNLLKLYCVSLAVFHRTPRPIGRNAFIKVPINMNSG